MDSLGLHRTPCFLNKQHRLVWAVGRSRERHHPLERSIYSLRHTAICMRLVLSHGQVSIYSLAKNAGTSVNQIERFYAKRLPISKELMENLQSFGR